MLTPIKWPSCPSTGLCEPLLSPRAPSEEAGRSQALCPCPWVGPTGLWSSTAQPSRNKEPGPQLQCSSQGKQGTPAEPPACICAKRAPFTTAQGQTAAYQPWPPAKAAWAPTRGMRSAPPPAVCSLLCLGAGTCHEMPAVTNRHHLMLPLWSGCPGDCRIWGGCFELLLAPAPMTGNWNSSSSQLWQVLGTFLVILHLWGPAVCCSSDGKSHVKCPERDQC